MRYEPKDYGLLKGMDGFSDELLENHLALYRGYVTHANQALDALSEMAVRGRASSYEPRSQETARVDVFEHAFMIDYGLKRGEYIEAFFRNIRWRLVGERPADSCGRPFEIPKSARG